jgi:hypothetical protein
MRGYHGENALCWLCDYWLVLFGILMVIMVGWFRFGSIGSAMPSVTPLPPMVETPIKVETPTSKVPVTIPTRISTLVTTTVPILPFVTPSAILIEKPEFVIVVIPVNWTGSNEAFAQNARQQTDFFIQESGMDNYFQISVEVLNQGLENVSLSDEQLVDKVIEFGLDVFPANRYIGLTDGDVVLDGSSDIVGWTYGPDTLGVVSESGGLEISAHELGHTFGLCDEYSYSYWTEQDEAFVGGCPNPYPSECERVESTNVMCPGNPTLAGLNSIMGPSGLMGQYGFNGSSFEYLQDAFQIISRNE